MEIAVLGAGRIGATLARRFASAGHRVRLSNSRGPQTIRTLAAEVGAHAMMNTEAVRGADVVVMSVPFSRVGALRTVLADAPDRSVLIDTSNYFPHRDGRFAGVDGGQVESAWVSEAVGRPVVKAWNNISAGGLTSRCACTSRYHERTALPVAGDSASAKYLAMYLVELTGFEAVDGGTIAASWRQQPGSPAYGTELAAEELIGALERADRASLTTRRDQHVARLSQLEGWGTSEERLRLAREAFL